MGNTSSGRQDKPRSNSVSDGGEDRGSPSSPLPTSSAPIDIARAAHLDVEVSDVFGSPLLSVEHADIPPLRSRSEDHLANIHADTSGTRPYIFRLECPSSPQTVGVSGSFNNWGPEIPLNKVADGLYELTLHLPPAVYEYKYKIDGQWHHDDTKPSVPNGLGSVNNVLEFHMVPDYDNGFGDIEGGVALRLNESDASLSSMVDGPQDLPMPGTPPGEYGQEIPDLRRAAGPPLLPPQLLQVTLNSEPKGNDPTELPVPSHVMLNHLYALSIKDNVMVLGATHRFQKKCVTTVLYKPVA